MGAPDLIKWKVFKKELMIPRDAKTPDCREERKLQNLSAFWDPHAHLIAADLVHLNSVKQQLDLQFLHLPITSFSFYDSWAGCVCVFNSMREIPSFCRVPC